MIRCAFLEMNRLPSSCTPRRTSASISSMSEPGSMTTPQPITHRHPGCRMPDGIECRTYFSRPTTTVWPALLPPAKRATTFTCGASMSTTLPLPSSPHCVPMTTMLGMACTSEYALWMFENLRDRQHALRSVRQIHRYRLAGRGARVADHEHLPRALRARVGHRLLEPAADDIAGDGGAEIAQPPRQRERRGLVAREVDDEEVRPRQRHRHALCLHDGERPAHVEREADRRAVVAEAPEHVVVASAGGDGGAEAGHVRLEIGPGVVVEAAHLAQVQQHALGQTVDLEQPVDFGQVRQRPRRPIVAREAGRALKYHLAAEEGRQRQERGAHVRRRR